MIILPLTDLCEYDSVTKYSEITVPVVNIQSASQTQSQVIPLKEPDYLPMNEITGMSDLDEEVIVNSDN